MKRIGWVGVVGAVVVGLVWGLWPTPDPGPASPPEPQAADGAPGLEGHEEARAKRGSALPQISDPVDYVLSSSGLGAIPAEARAEHLRALAARDAGFIDALLAWLAAPDGRTVGPPGVSTTRTPEGAMHKVLATIGAPVVDPLIAMLDEPRRDARYGAARALGSLDALAAPATQALLATAARSDEDRYVRAAAVDALGGLGDAGQVALPLVHATLRDPDCEEELGLACARNLVRLGGASPAVFDTCRRLLAEDWHAASILVLREVSTLGAEAEPLLPTLLALFEDPEYADAFWHVLPPVLAAIGDDGDAVLEFLSQMVRTARLEGSRDGGAGWALGHLGSRGRAQLLLLHEGEAADLRLAALRLLVDTEHDRRDLLARAAPLLAAESEATAQAAFALIARLQVKAADALPVLRSHLEHPDAQRQQLALGTLASLTSPTSEVLLRLSAGARAASEPVALTSLRTLSRLADTWPEQSLSVFLESMLDERPAVVWGGLHALASILPRHREPIVAAWLGAVSMRRTQEGALRLLAKHAPQDPRAHLAFRTSSRHPEPTIRRTAVVALGSAADPEDLGRVIALTRDPDLFVRVAASTTLAQFQGVDDPRALGALVDRLTDERPRVRSAAARVLIRYGARAAGVVEAMRSARASYVDHGWSPLVLDYAIREVILASRDP